VTEADPTTAETGFTLNSLAAAVHTENVLWSTTVMNVSCHHHISLSQWRPTIAQKLCRLSR